MTTQAALLPVGTRITSNSHCDIEYANNHFVHAVANNTITDSVYDRLYQTGCGKYMIVDRSRPALNRLNKCRDGCFPQ